MNTHPYPVALVTGASRGIGRGIALQLARDGYTVVICSVNASEQDTAKGAGEVRLGIEATGGRAVICRADVARAADRQALIDFLDQHYGRLDLLVSNAGVAPLERRDLLEASEESFDRVLGINLKGPYFLAQAAARKMVEWQTEGRVATPRIAFISSISAYTSSPSRGEYCVSKAGLSMTAKLFADRLAEYGIPVIEICPGIIATDMTAGVKEKYDGLIAQGLVPMRRWGTPEDVARVVSAFGRGDLDFCTGETIEVGGGFRLKRL